MSTDPQSVRDRIVAIIAEQAMLDPAELNPGMSPQEIGIDSMGLVESIFAIEEEFDISIPFNANEPEKSEFDISNMGAIIAAVEALVAAGHEVTGITRRDSGVPIVEGRGGAVRERASSSMNAATSMPRHAPAVFAMMSSTLGVRALSAIA